MPETQIQNIVKNGRTPFEKLAFYIISALLGLIATLLTIQTSRLTSIDDTMKSVLVKQERQEGKLATAMQEVHSIDERVKRIEKRQDASDERVRHFWETYDPPRKRK